MDKKMKSQAGTTLICILASIWMICVPSMVFAERGPSGCPLGVSPSDYVCFTLDEEADRQMKELNLERTLVDAKLDLARARAKRLKRLGWSLGPGLGTSTSGEFDAGLYLSYGFRF